MKPVIKQLPLFFLCLLIFFSCRKNIGEGSEVRNSPPVANAGADQTIVLPVNSVTLDGSASTDPDNNIISYRWAKISGPEQFRLPNGTLVKEQLTNLVYGDYEFQLLVTDAGRLYSIDTVRITVLRTALDTLRSDSISVISGPATLTSIGLLSRAKQVVPATAADKLVFAGGLIYDGNKWYPTPSVDIYNLSTNMWSTAALSEARGGMTVATVGNKILYAGGSLQSGQPSSRVDIYDAAANTWATTRLSMARYSMVTAVAGNKVFFTGFDYAEITNKVDVFDASSNSWSTASLSEARGGMSAIAIGNKVLFAGGYRKWDAFFDTPFDFSKRVDIYDIATNTWSVAELKDARSAMAAAVVGNRVLFAGGSYWADATAANPVKLNTVDIYDASTNTWSTAALSEARAYLTATTVGNKVLFAGDGSFTVDVYNATTNSWSTTRLSLVIPVSSTAVLGSKVAFFIGDPNNRRLDIYDASANSWSQSELSKPLSSFPITAGNKVFLGGGTVYTNATGFPEYIPTSSVWRLQF
jgi:N-acetylneuraminic acid mutarotase